jgi:YesN/AraC family two-component response regulator
VSVDNLTQVLDRQGMTTGTDGAGRDVNSAPTILVADDEPSIVATHTWLIQSQLPQARVLQASNGRQALSLMAQTRPDLVLLDLMMPEMDGFQVLVEMHEHPDLCNIPVVVLTAKTLSDDEVDRLTLGVATVLGKGLFSAEETLEHIEAALHRNGRSTTEETLENVRRAMAYIHEHYTEPLTRKDIARGVNLSARHLDRCFCEQMGITPITYLNRFRLRQSRRLLVSSSLSMSDISATVGFSDSGYFSRVFRRDTGVSPSEYRRTHS